MNCSPDVGLVKKLLRKSWTDKSVTNFCGAVVFTVRSMGPAQIEITHSPTFYGHIRTTLLDYSYHEVQVEVALVTTVADLLRVCERQVSDLTLQLMW